MNMNLDEFQANNLSTAIVRTLSKTCSSVTFVSRISAVLHIEILRDYAPGLRMLHSESNQEKKVLILDVYDEEIVSDDYVV
jgi:hypothetical protein